MKIKITETKVWIYEPDLESTHWLNEGITTIQGAMLKDKEDLEEGKITPEELTEQYEKVTYKVELIK